MQGQCFSGQWVYDYCTCSMLTIMNADCRLVMSMADSSSESESDSPVMQKAKYVKKKSLLVQLKENSQM